MGSQGARMTSLGVKSTRAYAPRVGKAEHDKYYDFIDVFRPLPWQIPVLNSKAPVILLTGSAGGGKSHVAARKIHAYCLTYPGATALIVRKTKTSLYNSVITMLKNSIMKEQLANGTVRHLSTASRFEYSNGSIIMYGGMQNEQQREAIRSAGAEGGIDIAWMEEAHQFEERDFEEIKGRIRGRAAPWRQIILSTNPDAPTHWIYVRMIIGKEARIFYSSARQNPHNPPDYQRNRLDTLQGILRDRLRDGKWVAAGHLVLDSWIDVYDNNDELTELTEEDVGNVTLDADYIPGGGPVYWFVDDGYAGDQDDTTGMFKAKSHPRVFLMVQLRDDGRLAVFNESYRVKTLAPVHIKQVITTTEKRNWPPPSRIVYDKAAASLGGYLRDELGSAWGTPKSAISYNVVPVEQGNNELNTYLAPDENGVRKILVHPRCRHLRMEMVSYKNNPMTGRLIKDFDHGPDALRIGVWDLKYGGPAEVDVSSVDDVIIENEQEEGSRHVDRGRVSIYEYGDADVAVLI